MQCIQSYVSKLLMSIILLITCCNLLPEEIILMPNDGYAKTAGSNIPDFEKQYPGNLIPHEITAINSNNITSDYSISNIQYTENNNGLSVKYNFGDPSQLHNSPLQELRTSNDSFNLLDFLTNEEFKQLQEYEIKRKQREKEIKKAVALQAMQNNINTIVHEESAQSPHILSTSNILKSSLPAGNFSEQLLQKRACAIAELERNPDTWDTAYYSLSNKSREFSKNKSIKIETYTKLYGTKIQHFVHTEIISIINEASKKALAQDATTFDYQIGDCILSSSEAARLLNTSGKWVQALEVNDFSITLLDPALHHHLIVQLSKAMTVLHNNNDVSDVSTQAKKIRKQLLQINSHSINGNQLVTVVEKYAKISSTHKELYVEVVQIIETICTDTLDSMPCTKICNIFNEQYESVYLQGLRKVALQGKRYDKLYESVYTIIGNKSCERSIFFKYLVTQDLNEKIALIIHPNFKDKAAGLFTRDGIFQEYALAANITQIPPSLCTDADIAFVTYQLLDNYQNVETQYQKDQAALGLINLKKSVSTREPHKKEKYQSLAKIYASVANTNTLIENKCNEYLEIEYIDQTQQNVQKQCVWFAEKIITAQEEIDPADETSERFLQIMQDQLENAFLENEKQNSQIAQEILTDTFQIVFGSNSLEDIYKKNNPIDLKKKLDKLASQQKDFNEHTFRKVNSLSATLDEKIEAAAHACRHVYLQSGTIISNLDTILSSDKPAVPISELTGFILTVKDANVQIDQLNESTLKDFQQLWPDETTLEDEVDLWHEELALWSDQNNDTAQTRFCARKEAYEKTKDNPSIFIERTYQLSSAAYKILHDNSIDPSLFSQGIYNQLQNQLHVELIDIIERTANFINHQAFIQDFKPSVNYLVDVVSTGVNANKLGDVITASYLADYSSMLADCAQATLEGMALGGGCFLLSKIENIPHAILFGVIPEIMGTYYAAKLACQVTYVGYIVGSAAFKKWVLGDPKEWDDGWKPWKELSRRDRFKTASCFLTNLFLGTKLKNFNIPYTNNASDGIKSFIENSSINGPLKNIEKLFRKQKIKAYNAVSKIPDKLKRRKPTISKAKKNKNGGTPNPIKNAAPAPDNSKYKKNKQQQDRYNEKPPKAKSLDKEIEYLENKFNNKLIGYNGVIKGKKLRFNFRHLFEPDPKQGIKDGEITYYANGFHHDLYNFFQKIKKYKGIEIEIISTKNLPGGFKTIEWRFPGGKPKKSTLWPSDWSREKAHSYVMQAWKNCEKNNILPEINQDKNSLNYIGEVKITGLPNALKIKFCIEDTGFVKTVYPYFEKKQV